MERALSSELSILNSELECPPPAGIRAGEESKIPEIRLNQERIGDNEL